MFILILFQFYTHTHDVKVYLHCLLDFLLDKDNRRNNALTLSHFWCNIGVDDVEMKLSIRGIFV